jgi:hypothetical protein
MTIIKGRKTSIRSMLSESKKKKAKKRRNLYEHLRGKKRSVRSILSEAKRNKAKKRRRQYRKILRLTEKELRLAERDTPKFLAYMKNKRRKYRKSKTQRN